RTPGLPILQGTGLPAYYLSPDAKTYFGGEPVLDPFSGMQLTYQGGEPVRDLFTGDVVTAGDVVTDPFGAPLLHAAGDPMLHIQGEPVVHVRGEKQLYLGGEPVFDENGNPVYTGTAPFTHSADQGVIQDRGQTVYYLVQTDGSAVPIGNAVFNVPKQTFANGISTSTELVATTLAHHVIDTTQDQVSITVYDGTDIYN